MEWSNGEMRLMATFLPVARWIALHTIPYAPSPRLTLVEGEGAGQRRGQRRGREWSTDNVDDLVVLATMKIVHNPEWTSEEVYNQSPSLSTTGVNI